MRVLIQDEACVAFQCKASDTVASLKYAIQEELGVDACDQCLIHAARPMTNIHRLSMYGVGQNSTIHLNRRMRGGASDWELIVKPRIQKDRWSDYWKESMETKTDMEPDIHLTVQPTMTVGEVQKQVEKKMGWLPTSKLKRMEGFKDPWESAVHKGRLVPPDKTLQDCGLASGSELITVRRVLVPEKWKIIKEGEEEEDSSSDEDW
ncbi:hypothetical protein CVIRNUC_005733 [Coccomyxa viridis]|uniref:Ubiquitin-like domain-containing protein n=1 Tax=Coccomyxa viridis TaxID=1274662 RepID=A0AAV1I5C4_9CHLO|nr:hypothetical protein CVIRNUC_005733 [Coccomyxa viridis]